MNYAALVIGLLAATTGFLAASEPDIPDKEFSAIFESSDKHNHDSHEHSQAGYRLGSAHRHALFYVVVNGSEKDFLEPRYQLAESYVRLENNRSHIVHSHAESVTWNEFLESINVTAEEDGEELCVTAKNSTHCGEGEVWYNGDGNASLDSRIMQGDKLILAIGPDHEDEISRYRSSQLPKDYVPEERRGRRL